MTAWGGRKHPDESHEEPSPVTVKQPGYRDETEQVKGLQIILAQSWRLFRRIETMQTIINITRADWSPAIRAAAYRAAYVVAVLIVAAELTYRAGLATGHAIHWLSDRLAGLASGRIDRAATARAAVKWAHSLIDPPASPAVVVMACAAAPAAPVAVSPPALDSLTVAELRKMARARGLTGLARKGRRADLLSALC